MGQCERGSSEVGYTLYLPLMSITGFLASYALASPFDAAETPSHR
jgi:hypothetical protein